MSDYILVSKFWGASARRRPIRYIVFHHLRFGGWLPPSLRTRRLRALTRRHVLVFGLGHVQDHLLIKLRNVVHSWLLDSLDLSCYSALVFRLANLVTVLPCLNFGLLYCFLNLGWVEAVDHGVLWVALEVLWYWQNL